jgi:hypothetical protein
MTGSEEAGIEITLMERTAKEAISSHVKTATITSTAAGIPGGLAMAATIPADLIQFYYHVIVIAQQIAYIYGFKSVDEAQFDEFLTILIGEMMNIAEANSAFKELVMEQFSQKIGKITLGKILDKTVAHVAIEISVQLGKRSILKSFTKAVPLVGGVVSGGMTYAQLKPMCDNLNNKLYDSVEAKRLKKSGDGDVNKT